MGVRFEDVFEPDNASNAALIKGLLADEGIHAEILSFHDTAFDGIFQAQKGWGRIRVRAEDAERAREILQEWQDAPRENDAPRKEDAPHEGDAPREEAASAKEQRAGEPSPASPDLDGGPLLTPRHRVDRILSVGWKIVLPVLLLLSVAANLYFVLPKKPEALPSIQTEWDGQGRILGKHYYRNSDRFPHRSESYDTRGRLVFATEDDDGDGRVEKSISYDQSGELLSEYFDRNADGRFEQAIDYHRGQMTVRHKNREGDDRTEVFFQYHRGAPRAAFEDRDGDGRTDRVRLLGQGRGQALLEDRDGDGFPEILTCSAPTGKRVEVDALACAVRSP